MPEFIGVPEAGQWRSKASVRPIGSLMTQPAYQRLLSSRQLDAVHSNVYDGRWRCPSFVTLGPILLNYRSDMESDPKYQPGDSPVPESQSENVIISPTPIGPNSHAKMARAARDGCADRAAGSMEAQHRWPRRELPVLQLWRVSGVAARESLRRLSLCDHLVATQPQMNRNSCESRYGEIGTGLEV